MQRKVIALRPGERVGDAIRELERAGVSGAPVMDGGRLVGIVSLDELFRCAGVDPRRVMTEGPWHRYEHVVASSPRTVAEAMSRRVVSLPPGTPIARVALTMREFGINRIPIVDQEGTLHGIVARDDVITAVAEAALRVRGMRSSMAPD
jgi:CBS domain-containing protein